MTENTKNLVTAAATLGVAAATCYWWQLRKNSSAKKTLHIDVPSPEFPFAMRAMTALLPNATRRNMILKQSNPKPPIDGVDALGPEYNPYTELGRELIPNKLWRVRYRYVQNVEFGKFLALFMGISLEDPAVLDIAPADLRSKMEATMKERAAMEDATKGMSKDEKYQYLTKQGFEESQDMIVVKLQDGGLLLFNPCRMHPPVLEWVDKVGPVRYLVSGSSSHTNQMQQASKAFPLAKIICSQVADEKCRSVGMRPADYLYTNPDSLQEVSRVMKDVSGNPIRLVYLEGDTVTHNLCLVAYNHLLEVDLACYGNGKRLLMVDEKDWEQLSPDDPKYSHICLLRLFYGCAYPTAVQAGYLPNFRLLAMDPTSLLSQWMSLEEPKPDGSSCQEMAQSIRTLLQDTNFDVVDSAHSLRNDSIPAEEFKQAVNDMWKWLDGHCLLSPEQ